MYLFTNSHERPGSQVNKQPISSSTSDAFTFIAVKAESPTSSFPLARMYRVRATREAAATIADEFTFAA